MKVYALYLDFPNGTDLQVFETREKAIDSLYDFVAESWHEVEEHVSQSLPADKNKAIDLYFETKQEDFGDIEFYELKECEIL